ncbi:Methicillin resistance mecR1 protein [Gimesia panareensis]|uniref:Methicillin resistance mecR1 protein n=1 Tax=Gimesia panareensis TaxID=2527978 RepID=A0A518FGH1_9PLAN|nr:M56 family metallopeptidase [Gimesia panareensis]QDV15433.1 Methicillin resistance mecR1 protein [Gimesia panareensis]
MAALTLWNPGDHLLVGSLNVLLQVTLVTSVILLLALFVRRQPTTRYGLLCAGLLLILLSPAISSVMQTTGQGLLGVSLQDESVSLNQEAARKTTVVETKETSPPDHRNLADTQKIHRTTVVDGQGLHESEPENSEASFTSLDESSESMAGGPVNQPATIIWIGDILRTVMPGLLLVWLSGSILLLFRLIVGWCRLAFLLRTAQPNTDPVLAIAFARAGQVFPRNRLPVLILSQHVSGPVSTGLFRSCVVFPEQAVGQLSPEQLREIFIHEIAHTIRHDQIVLLFQNLVAALFWFHPLVKVLNRQLTQAREEICDNYVLLSTTNATSYSRTLLTFARSIQTEKLLPGAIGLFGARWKLEQRVAGLLDQNRNRQTRLTRKYILVLVALSMTLATGLTIGTVTIAVAQTKKNSAVDHKKTALTGQSVLIRGTITGPDGTPASGALVAVSGLKTRHGAQTRRELLGEGVTDDSGHYELSLPGNAAENTTSPTLIARTDQSGIAWRKVDLKRNPTTADLKLPPEQLIQVRFVDPEGHPANQLNVDLISIIRSSEYQGYLDPASGIARQGSESKIWPVSLKTDERGILTLKYIAPENGVYLETHGTERFAPQELTLNSGFPEKRGENDGTYRSLVRNNIKPGEVTTITLAPTQFFEGTVLLGESGKPAADARISIWASQQEQFGSMVAVESRTDTAGRFRLNPKPGVRFGIIAYPPKGTPYQAKELKDLRWKPGTASKNIQIKLGKVVLARGTVIDARTGKPLAGASVQYEPESARNKNDSDDIITGWQGIQKTDSEGKFSIPVLPGPGTLLFHAASRNYILQERDSQKLYSGKPGGARIYAHAFQSIDPTADQPLQPMKIKLEPGQTVSGTLVDEQGKPIKHALMISRLKILPTSPDWRGWPDEVFNGTFELQGLRPGVEYPVFFLDPQHQLGAAARISTRNNSRRIILKPCGSAQASYVDPEGKPISGKSIGSLYLVVTPGAPRYDLQASRRGELWADEALTANLDRVNYHGAKSMTTNTQGKITFPALIPGAIYRCTTIVDGRPQTVDEFVVQPEKLHDIGNVEVHLKE